MATTRDEPGTISGRIESANPAALAVATRAGTDAGVWTNDDVDPADGALYRLEAGPDGRLVAPINSGQDRLLLVGADRPTKDLVVRTDPGSIEVDLALDPRPIRVGQEVVDAVTYLRSLDVYEVDLAKGERVTAEVSSATGGAAVMVVPPGTSWGGSTLYEGDVNDDQVHEGAFGVVATGTFTADVPGRYQLLVLSTIRLAATYRLRLERAS